MISPTGHGVRGQDKWGSGLYLAGRGNRLHPGEDYIAIVKPVPQEIVAPTSGLILRERFPYSEPVEGVFFGGVQMQCPNCVITMFYFQLDKKLIKMNVKEGQVIGIAQDIGLKYPGIISHVHLQFDSIRPGLFINLP